MTGYILRRILWILPVLFVIATITFFLMNAVPGGPFTAEGRAAGDAGGAARASTASMSRCGSSTLKYMRNLARDLGISFKQDRAVTEMIRKRVFITLQIGILAMLLASSSA